MMTINNLEEFSLFNNIRVNISRKPRHGGAVQIEHGLPYSRIMSEEKLAQEKVQAEHAWAMNRRIRK